MVNLWLCDGVSPALQMSRPAPN